MPIYEYRCGACEVIFEEWQKVSDPPVDTCPKCGAKQAEKIMSATAFILQGTGWYATDYGGKSVHSKPSKKAVQADAERMDKRDKELTLSKMKSQAESPPSVSSGASSSSGSSGSSSGSGSGSGSSGSSGSTSSSGSGSSSKE